MEKKLTLTLRDVYGGDGIIRYEDASTTKLARTKTSKRTRADIGVAIEAATDELVSEKIKREIHTFQFQDGHPTLRLGGTHGKLWGTLRAIRSSLYTLGDPAFKSAKLMDMIAVIPVWVELEVLEPIVVQQLPQILNSPGRPMVITYFDVIPLAKCEVTLVYPDIIKKQVATLLEQLHFVSFLNKRRATLVSLAEVK